MFRSAAVPPIARPDRGLDDLGALAAGIAPRGARVLVVCDAGLAATGAPGRALAALDAAGFEPGLFDRVAGEPGAALVREAAAAAAGAALVVGIGGGSALDTAKIAAACGPSGADPVAHACGRAPLPDGALPKIMVPTTSGTGAETCATAVFAGPGGRKLWLWGQGTKAESVLLDPLLTHSLPPGPTAACGMDALVHAFEAATNRNAHPCAELYAHAALSRIQRALPRAVAAPDDAEARTEMALAACFAGVAIDNCGTAVAHLVSHALASLVPVSHGLATALAFEATLPWLCAAPTPALGRAAEAMGTDVARLPGHVSRLMDAAGIERRLLPVGAAVTAEALAAEMAHPDHAPMRRASARDVTEDDLGAFAGTVLALARPGVPA